MNASDWNMVKLSDACEIIMGQSPPGHTYNKEGNGLPFYQGKVDFGKVYLLPPSTWCTKPLKIAEPNNILISVRAPVGPTNLCSEKCCIGRGLAAIRPNKEMDSWFIFYFLRSIESEISNSGSGSTFSAISKSQICNLQIPLPPLEDQHRIASKLQELMQEIYKLKSAIKNQSEAAKALPSAYLREVFESEEAKKWERKRLGEVGEIVTGSTPRTDDPDNWNGSILWTTPNDMGKLTGFTIDDTERKISEKGFNTCSTKLLPPGSVLLTTRAPIGHLAINLKPICTNQGFKSFIPSPRVHNWFLFFALKYFVPVLQSMGRGQTFTEISKGQVENFEIPLPSLTEQHRIANDLKEKMAQVENLQSKILNQQSALDALPQAILRKAFRGEL